MAGSWEPLPFRVRRDGSPGYTPTDQQRADYQAEHSPQMLDKLKALGVNFVMMHCYKGAGTRFEAESMADAVRFADLCHQAGLHVGCYAYSGAFLWEPLFKEVPQAEQWVVLGDEGKAMYGFAGYRYFWNRNHPDAVAYYQNLVRFAVDRMHTDLVHLDNYNVGPGRDANSVARFRQYLRATFTAGELQRAGVAGPIGDVQPPRKDSPLLLRCAWADFSCQSLADSYQAMARFARSLRPDVLFECNPGGVAPVIYPPVDHGRLLSGGEAFWDEGLRPGVVGGAIQSRIRTYKVARAMNNMAFTYILTPLEAAESMAFNRDCLGAICWFEYGKIVAQPGVTAPLDEAILPYVRFFHRRRELLRGGEVLADVAVLRDFPSQVFAEPKHAVLTARVEDLLVALRIPFQIVYDHQLADLGRYRALVLAGCVALDDAQIGQIRRYVAGGGRLCVIGQAATHDRWLAPRAHPALDDLRPQEAVRVEPQGDLAAGIVRACGGRLSLTFEPWLSEKAAPPKTPGPQSDKLFGLCSEVIAQPGKLLVHLVNYRSGDPIPQFVIRMRLPEGKHVERVSLASPSRGEDLPLKFMQQGTSLLVAVPQVKQYEIAVIEW
jgi:hypothetical protein